MDPVLIGTVAEVTGVSTQTIRLYERRGLLWPADRLANGYRHYGGDTVDRLGFIQSAQASGLTLAEIGSILAMRDAELRPCDHVVQLLGDKLLDVRERRQQLARLEVELERLLEGSTRMNPTDCAEEDICQIISGTQQREASSAERRSKH